MILSQRQLEEIAASTTKDFNRFFFGDEADKPDRSALPTPIDQFAKNYLGLRVSFARLSPDGSICGVTAYADTEYKITELGITRTLALKRNQVILDESFIRSGNVQRLCAKRRFTLAHECAHQILFQLESEEVKASCEMRYSAHLFSPCLFQAVLPVVFGNFDGVCSADGKQFLVSYKEVGRDSGCPVHHKVQRCYIAWHDHILVVRKDGRGFAAVFLGRFRSAGSHEEQKSSQRQNSPAPASCVSGCFHR